MDRNERDELLHGIERLNRLLHGPAANQAPTETLRGWMSERTELKRRYLKGLPDVSVSRCPYCGAVVTKTIDTYGLDGIWWNDVSVDIPPRACGHFAVLLGSVNFHGQVPEVAAPNSVDRIIPGPEVPYVVPRLLEMNGMVCVISSVGISDDRFTAYLMAYFASQPIPPEEGHQAWLREAYGWTDAKGHQFWNTRNDAWDFDLADWIARAPDKLRWIEPGDRTLSLRSAAGSSCPYAGLDGRRAYVEIVQGQARASAPPDGTEIGAGIVD